MIYGFTGTRQGMSVGQFARFIAFVQHEQRRFAEFHHGDCKGADEDAHRAVRKYAPDCRIFIHPPEDPKHRAFCAGDIVLKEVAFLSRNHLIVDACQLLIATPQSLDERQRSGTWATIRYARKIGREVHIINP